MSDSSIDPMLLLVIAGAAVFLLPLLSVGNSAANIVDTGADVVGAVGKGTITIIDKVSDVGGSAIGLVSTVLDAAGDVIETTVDVVEDVAKGAACVATLGFAC